MRTEEKTQRLEEKLLLKEEVIKQDKRKLKSEVELLKEEKLSFENERKGSYLFQFFSARPLTEFVRKHKMQVTFWGYFPNSRKKKFSLQKHLFFKAILFLRSEQFCVCFFSKTFSLIF